MDPYGLDHNQIVTDLVKDFSISVFDKATGVTAAQIKKLKTTFKIGFDEYLAQTIADSSLVKTILYRDRPENIGNIYVDQMFRCDTTDIDEASIRNDIFNSKSVVVCGAAGTGKSFFVKNLVYQAALKKECFPIAVELRHVEQDSPSILQHIVANVFNHSLPNFDKDDLDYALKTGLFFLVLDGMDEVLPEVKPRFLKEVEYISKRYRKLSVVVTSRPDTATESLPKFPVYRVQPLSKPSATALVEALRFDEVVKKPFLTELNDRLYDKHKEFASNPLLLTMLLITFDQVGQIPDKMHIFYSQAFEALVFKHDLMKARYVRPQKAGLEVNQLRRVYAHFCARTYLTGQLSFSEVDILDELERSLLYANAKSNAADLVHDLILCFSMLKRDGLKITFVHRSFQEYFCAVHISSSTMENKRNIISKLAASEKSEQTFGLLADMNPELVAIEWAVPLISESVKMVSQLIDAKDYAALFRLLFHYFAIQKSSDGYVITVGHAKRWLEMLSFEQWTKHYLETSQFIEMPELSEFEINFETFEEVTDTIGQEHEILGLKMEPETADNHWICKTPFPEYFKKLHDWLNWAEHKSNCIASPSDDLSKDPYEIADTDHSPSYRDFKSTKVLKTTEGRSDLINTSRSRRVFE